MARVTKEQIPEVAAFMARLWECVKEFYIPEEADAYWDRLLAEADQAVRQADNKLCEMLMTAFLSYLQERWKNDQRDNKGDQGY